VPTMMTYGGYRAAAAGMNAVGVGVPSGEAAAGWFTAVAQAALIARGANKRRWMTTRQTLHTICPCVCTQLNNLTGEVLPPLRPITSADKEEFKADAITAMLDQLDRATRDASHTHGEFSSDVKQRLEKARAELQRAYELQAKQHRS